MLWLLTFVLDWKDIFITDYATDAVYDEDTGAYISGSIVQNCIIEFAGTGADNTGALTIHGSSPYVDSCAIRHNARPGVYADMTGAPRLVSYSGAQRAARAA